MTGQREPSRGDLYDSNYERREAAGENVHGEADFVVALAPTSVLDAGCGTGRIGRELARRGVDVVGVDLDADMLETARRKAPAVRWICADLTEAAAVDELGRTFDLVLMAGNVINFVHAPRRGLAISQVARVLRPGGHLVDGHSLRAGDTQLADYDGYAAAAGLQLIDRWSTWDRDDFQPGSPFAVSVFRKPAEGASGS